MMILDEVMFVILLNGSTSSAADSRVSSIPEHWLTSMDSLPSLNNLQLPGGSQMQLLQRSNVSFLILLYLVWDAAIGLSQSFPSAGNNNFSQSAMHLPARLPPEGSWPLLLLTCARLISSSHRE